MHTYPLIKAARLPAVDALWARLAEIFDAGPATALGDDSQQAYLAKPGVRTSYRAQLERWFRARLDVDERWAVRCVSSATNAIRLALRALRDQGLATRRRVIVPAITVPSTAEAVLMEGCVPVVVDVDPVTWLIDLEAAEAAVTGDTAAVISVDWLGHPVDAAALRAFAARHGVLWISDSAQSFGSRFQGRPVGGAADATVLSTGYPKVFHTAGKGGVLVIPADAAAALDTDPRGVLRHEVLPEIHAAFGLELTTAFAEQLVNRQAMYRRYRQRLTDVAGVRLPAPVPGSEPNGYQASLLIEPSARTDAHATARRMREAGIRASDRRVNSLAHDKVLAGHVEVPGPVSHAHHLHQNCLTVPVWNDMDTSDVDRVVSTLERSLGGGRHV